MNEADKVEESQKEFTKLLEANNFRIISTKRQYIPSVGWRVFINAAKIESISEINIEARL